MADESPNASAAEELLLQLQAEFELVRRKAELLERRLVEWEKRQSDAVATLERLGQLHAGEGEADAHAELERRVARLERRREAPRALVQLPTDLEGQDAPAPPDSPDAMAIVRARFHPADAAPGETITLTARVDGISAGTPINFDLYGVGLSLPFERLTGSSDGDVATCEWTLPTGLEHAAVYFVVHFEHVDAQSPPLYLPLDSDSP
jgi:hypothetical protein